MKPDVFVDTSGFYAALVRKDEKHGDAAEYLVMAAERRTHFVTTDYILDETATLLQARGLVHLVDPLFEIVFSSAACRVEWMDTERFMATRGFFQQHEDHAWSFTDCFSFVMMKELGITDALTKDGHFREAGFTPLLT